MEEGVTIHARSCDVDIVSTAAKAAQESYTGISGRTVVIEVEGTLPKDRYVPITV